MSDNPQPAVTAELPRVTIQVSDKQPTLESTLLRDLVYVYEQAHRTGECLTQNVLAYLASVEDGERDPWVKTDIRIAWLTVLYAAREYQEPHVYATYMTIGLHPSKVWSAIQERRVAILGQPSPSPKKRPHRVKKAPLVNKAVAGGD